MDKPFLARVVAVCNGNGYGYEIVGIENGYRFAVHEYELVSNPEPLGPGMSFTVPGVKYDQEKSRVDLIPFRELLQVGDVLAYGARKYSPDNWKHVPDAKSRYLGAALRHIFEYASGHKNDKESGLPALAHAVTSLLFLMHFVNEDG